MSAWIPVNTGVPGGGGRLCQRANANYKQSSEDLLAWTAESLEESRSRRRVDAEACFKGSARGSTQTSF